MKTINFLNIVLALVISVVCVALFQHNAVAGGISIATGIGLATSGGYNKIYQELKQAYPGSKITPSTLRVERPITNGNQTYQFRFSQDSNSDTLTERKMAISDKFRVVEIGMFLINRLTTSIYTEVLQTYPNIFVFPDVSSTFYGIHLEVFYNGYLGLKVDQDVVIEELDTFRFRKAGALQQSSATTKSSMIDKEGFISDIPSITLDGSKQNVLEIKAPITDIHLVKHPTTNYTHMLVVIARGFRIR